MFWFFRPKWKSRNAKKRRMALEKMDLDEKTILIMARSDADVEVRKLAFQKMMGIDKYYSLWLGEQTEEGKKEILSLLAARINDSNEPIRLLEESLPQEHVIRSFPLHQLIPLINEEPVQEFIFSKVTSNNILSEMTQMDSPYRQRALAKIDNPILLQQILKTIQNNDKRSQRAIQERINTIHQAQAREAAEKELIEQYRLLSSREELLALNKLNELDRSWQQHGLPEEHELKKRFKSSYLDRHYAFNQMLAEQRKFIEKTHSELESSLLTQEALESIRVELDARMSQSDASLRQEIQALIPIVDQQVKEKKKAGIRQKNLKGLSSRVEKLLSSPFKIDPPKLQMAIEEIKEAIKVMGENDQYFLNLQQLNERVQRQNNATKTLEDYEGRLNEVNELIQNGETNQASQVLQDFEEEMSHMYSLNYEEYKRLQHNFRNTAQPLRNMQQWARWGSKQTLDALCDEAERLKDDELSNDLVVIRLKQLRRNWSDAAQSNRRQAGVLQKRFDEACEKAFTSVREERAENSAHREVYLKEAEQLLQQFSDWKNSILSAEEKNWLNIQQTRSTFLNEWNQYLVQKSLGERLSFGSPLFLEKDKNKLEQQMRKILKTLNQQINKQQNSDKERRRALIEDLKVLSEGEDISVAVTRAREIRHEFLPKIGLRHRDENQLWKDFRHYSHLIFEKQQEQILTNDREREINATLKQDILNELEEIIQNVDHSDRQELLDLLHQFDEKWEAIGATPKATYKQFNNDFLLLKNNVLEKQRMWLTDQVKARFAADILAMDKLSQIEAKFLNTESISEEMLEDIMPIYHTELKKRYECLAQIISGNESAKNHLLKSAKGAKNEAHKLVLFKEIITESETPEEDKEYRLQLQIEKLPEFMTGNVNRDVHKQLSILYNSWFEKVVGIVDESLKIRFLKEFDHP